MGLITPDLPAFDPEDWASRPFHERVKLSCQDWAVNGFGAPLVVYAFYLTKLAIYIGVWVAFVTATPGIGGPTDIGQWWSEPIAFQKAIVWTMAFEGLGLGAASGPLTGRYWPPFGGFLHFLRPGTTRLPPFPRIPGTPGYRRTGLDVALYVAHYVLVFRALAAPSFDLDVVVPLLVLLPLIGLRDKTIFLASRSEHYYTMLLVFLFAGDVIAGSKIVQAAIWWWAATSKLNRHFPAVITVMISNSPLLRWQRLRRALYRDHPEDLRPSFLARALAHGGTAFEYTFPLLLVLGDGGALTVVGLTMMTAFHTFIITSAPMGVPLEWNVVVVYSAFVLFGAHADVAVTDLASGWLVAILFVAIFVVPLVGNLLPSKISFLPSMRYYAGNWAYSMWLFAEGALDRLDERVTKAAPDLLVQLARFYDEGTMTALAGRAFAFRAMHLPARALHDALPIAADGDIERYELRDGEVVAGLVLGWNFGDGHLHHEQLMEAIQQQCDFAPGDVRAVFVESQPLHRPTHHWRIVDAAEGQLAEGYADVRDLWQRQPWPEPTSTRT